MYKYKLVVVDDHLNTSQILKYNLDRVGYSIRKFDNACEAIKYINAENTDLVVTDWILPGMDGLDLCTSLKQNPSTNQIPVIIVSSKNDEIDVVTALEVGVEDYIIKPFKIREMLTRIKKILKRKLIDDSIVTIVNTPRELVIRGNLKMDLASYKVFLEGKLLELTISEFKFLELLARNPGQVFTRTQMIESLNGTEYYATERSIDVQIVGLRKKLGLYKKTVETVRSVGYRFNEIYLE